MEMTVSQWADMHRGAWETAKTPYLRDIMDACNDEGTCQVVVMHAACSGISEFLVSIAAFWLDRGDPVLMMQPSSRDARIFNSHRLLNVRHRYCKGTATLQVIGADQSCAGQALPVRVVLADQIDLFPVRDWDNPLTDAISKTRSFARPVEVLCSIPVTDGESAIALRYACSSMEEWCLPCPSCGTVQPLTWHNFNVGNASVWCCHCRRYHTQKEWLQGEGRYVARYPGRDTRGFHFNALVVPWISWADMAAGFLRAAEIGEDGIRAWCMAFGTPYSPNIKQPGEYMDEEFGFETFVKTPAVGPSELSPERFHPARGDSGETEST